jgi:hypothetical protein
MSRKLIHSILATALLLTSSFAHADETTDALEALKIKIRNLVSTTSDPSIDNAKKVQIAKSQRPVLELELKQIIQSESRTTDNESIHDTAYDSMDDYMIGVAALSLLELKKDQASVDEISCEKANGMLDMLVKTTNPAYMPFKHSIKTMCASTKSPTI